MWQDMEAYVDGERGGVWYDDYIYRGLPMITVVFPSLPVSQSCVHLIGSRPGANSRKVDPCSTEEWQLDLSAELSSGCLLDVSHGGAHQDLHRAWYYLTETAWKHFHVTAHMITLGQSIMTLFSNQTHL